VHVKLAWVEAGRVVLRTVEVPADASVGDALAALGEPLAGTLRTRIDDGRLAVAVYGRPRSMGSRLRDGDRIELVGELVVDPKTARRLRVQQRRDEGADPRWKRR